MKSAVIVAGGASARFGENKLFADILGMPLIWYTVEKFFGVADEIILVTSLADKDKMWAIFGGSVRYAVGGETRTRSVIAGLQCIDPASSLVAIHDGARPFVSKALIERCFDRAATAKSAVPVIEAADTLMLDDVYIDRKKVLFVQTPQVFDSAKIVRAYAKFAGDETDDSRVWQKMYGGVTYVEGERSNVKVTLPGDIRRQKIGCGYDIHKLAKNRPLVLGGVNIPFHKGLLGHSDADVVAHSIMDAVLSAAGEKDIGHQFPNTDPRYKGISSIELLGNVMGLLLRKNAFVQNVSVAIVCEAPKLAPYIEKMKETLADAMFVSPLAIDISATTAEGIDEIGRGKAIAARAAAIVLFE